MFEIAGEATPAQILDSAAGLVRARIELDNAVLFHAVAWADRNGPETIHPDQLAIRGGDHPVQLGGDGTPQIADLAAAELGVALNMSTGAASALIGDSLDLRHRLPRLWAKICDCTFPGWQGRKIAKETRNLTQQQAAQVDQRLAGYAGHTPWTRLETRLTAAVADADTHAAEAEAQLAQARRGVWVGQSNKHGVKTVYARMDAPAAIRLLGQVNRISDILNSRHVIGNADSRRANALGVLGDPVQAAWLIAQCRQPELFDPAAIQPTSTSSAGSAAEDANRANVAQSNHGGEIPAEASHAATAPAGPDNFDDPALVSEADIHPSQHDLPGDTPATGEHGTSQPRRVRNDEAPQTLEAFQVAVARIIDNLDLNQLRPTTQLIVHTAAETLHHGHGSLRCHTSTPRRRPTKRPAKRSGQVVEDLGPMTMPTVQAWLLHHRITLRPVIDLNQPPPPVDSYEIPQRHRQHLALRYPASLFPWSTSKHGLDLDHVIPYVPPEHGGPPGQTSIQNLVPVSRREHRLFTHAGWQRRQPEPGTLLVRAPHGHIYLTNNTGTHNLGTSTFANSVWKVALTAA